uniref:Uncharacterized protein n=1 Tax=Cannabis sativa TaxID=3483 RepID=A0A803QRJ1_CANSA
LDGRQWTTESRQLRWSNRGEGALVSPTRVEGRGPRYVARVGVMRTRPRAACAPPNRGAPAGSCGFLRCKPSEEQDLEIEEVEMTWGCSRFGADSSIGTAPGRHGGGGPHWRLYERFQATPPVFTGRSDVSSKRWLLLITEILNFMVSPQQRRQQYAPHFASGGCPGMVEHGGTTSSAMSPTMTWERFGNFSTQYYKRKLEVAKRKDSATHPDGEHEQLQREGEACGPVESQDRHDDDYHRQQRPPRRRDGGRRRFEALGVYVESGRYS